MDERLQAVMEGWGCSDPRPLSGDAGARRYVRVRHPHVGTAIVVLYPPAPDPGWDDPYYDYRALQAYLDPVVRVPTILQYDDVQRAMLLEDVGDETLERRLTSHPEEENIWAEAAGALLALWTGLLTEGAPKRAFFMLRRFDRGKFDDEWAYCREHFFRDFLQKDPPRWLDRMMETLHEELEPRARHLAHRDFHVRNLMVRGGHLVVLDFQDARRGAATYDLASILFDGYWDWGLEAQERLVEALRQEVGWGTRELWEELNLSALQRNFKALGTFGFQLVHRNKAHFAPAVPRTLRHLLGHFQRLHHGEGVLQVEHWLRLAEARLLGRL